MKFIIVTYSLVIFNLHLNAQKLKSNEVPIKVREAFSKAYPAVKVEEWEKENIYYEAEFEIDKKEMSVSFDESGNMIETEIEILTTELPAPIKDYLNKNEAGKKIKEASKITNSKDLNTYEVDINKTDYIFDESGVFLSKEINSEKD